MSKQAKKKEAGERDGWSRKIKGKKEKKQLIQDAVKCSKLTKLLVVEG